MKNILISLFSIFIIFACSSTPVEKVDVQETRTVDLTDSSNQDDKVMMSDLDLGEASPKSKSDIITLSSWLLLSVKSTVLVSCTSTFSTGVDEQAKIINIEKSEINIFFIITSKMVTKLVLLILHIKLEV